MVDLTAVSSSNIAAIGHDPDANELHVQFKDGARYAYEADAAVHEAMLKAESAGKYFHANVRAQFKGRRVED